MAQPDASVPRTASRMTLSIAVRTVLTRSLRPNGTSSPSRASAIRSSTQSTGEAMHVFTITSLGLRSVMVMMLLSSVPRLRTQFEDQVAASLDEEGGEEEAEQPGADDRVQP